MCGIAGVYGNPDVSIVRKMVEAQIHRGPDDTGTYADDTISLGMCRLAIIGPENGKQPIKNKKGNLILVFNGEIYNYKALKKKLEKKHEFTTASDAEVIIHLYEEMGMNLLKQLRGMFAFALYDTKKKLLFLARDRTGIKPLYYMRLPDGRLMFASEIKAFKADPEVTFTINRNSVSELFQYHFVPWENTLISEVKKLPPGHFMLFDGKECLLKSYWNCHVNIDYSVSEVQWKMRIRNLLEASVKEHMTSDVPLGICLSGGLDSAIISALTQRMSQEPIRTFTAGFEDDTIDIEAARNMASELETIHEEFILEYDKLNRSFDEILWHLEEPTCSTAIYLNFFLARGISKHRKVVLTGEGADELFAGYSKYVKLIKAPPPQRPEKALHVMYDKSRQGSHLRNIMADKPASSLQLVGCLKNIRDDKREYLNQALRFDILYELPDYHLLRADKMFMAHSVEARVPFLDHRLVETALMIPSSMKIKDSVEKWILRQSFRTILPAWMAKKEKIPMNAPIASWIKSGLLELAEQKLDNLRTVQFIDKKQILRTLAGAKKFDPRFFPNLLILTQLASWYEMFIGR